MTALAPMKLDTKAPHTVYKNAAGKRVPSVTTVLGVLAKPALIQWAARVEREGVLACMERGEALPEAYFSDATRDRAADIGTITHARAEAFLRGTTLDPEGLDADLYAASDFGFARFVAWWRERGLTVLHSELGMVSEKLQVGGTADIICREADGSLTLLDLKTSKASKYWPYSETYGQVACYAGMYHETRGELVARIDIWRIGKDAGDEGQVVTLTAEQRSAGGDLFLAARAVYDAQKALGR